MSVVIGFQLIVLIFSVIIHEISHGAMALYLGDDTAKRMGRLTFNPLKHLDPFGSVILPLILVAIKSPILIGWAKPVPYNPYNLPNPKKGAALIGAAGPLSNITIAVIFSLLMHLAVWLKNPLLIVAFGLIILINLLLAIFNLVPIPPLDGSKLLFALLPSSWSGVQYFLERNGFLLLLLFLFLGFQYLWSVVLFVFFLLLTVTGTDPNIVSGAIVSLISG